MKMEVRPIQDKKTGSFTCCRRYRISRKVSCAFELLQLLRHWELPWAAPAAIPTQQIHRTPACNM